MSQIHQRGVGLMEVLVALLLLAIGVLGFALLQVRAIDASLEASKRIQAMNLAKDIAERIRANQKGLTKDIEVTTAGKTEVYKAYIKAFQGKEYLQTYDYSNCFGTATACNSEEFAKQDANQALYKAYLIGMKVGMDTCPGTVLRSRYCIYVAWDETSPKNGTGNDNCTSGGSYRSNSKCIVMETY